MGKVSKDGKGKTLYIELSVYPCGSTDTNKNLTISCPDKNTEFKTTLTNHGLKEFKDAVLKFYRELVTERQ